MKSASLDSVAAVACSGRASHTTYARRFCGVSGPLVPQAMLNRATQLLSRDERLHHRCTPCPICRCCAPSRGDPQRSEARTHMQGVLTWHVAELGGLAAAVQGGDVQCGDPGVVPDGHGRPCRTAHAAAGSGQHLVQHQLSRRRGHQRRLLH